MKLFSVENKILIDFRKDKWQTSSNDHHTLLNVLSTHAPVSTDIVREASAIASTFSVENIVRNYTATIITRNEAGRVNRHANCSKPNGDTKYHA